MDVQHIDQIKKKESDSAGSGRWIRDQLREVADSGLAELERSAVQRGEPKTEKVTVEDQSLLDSLATSISSAVVEPMRNLERSRVAHQHQMEESLAKLSKSLEEMQRRFGVLDRELENAKSEAKRSEARIDELRPGIAAAQEQVKTLEQSFRKDLDALGEGLAAVREQVEPLESRLAASEKSTAEHSATLGAVRRLERRRQEASSQVVTSVEGLRASLSRLSGLEMEAVDDEDPPAPQFAGDEADGD